MGAPYGGLLAAVNGVGSAQQWQVNDDQDLHSPAASNTFGGEAKKRGTYHWNGSFVQYGAKPQSGKMPGDIFAFVGYTEPNDNVEGEGMAYEGNAMVDSIQIVWDWNTQAPLMINTAFTGHGPLVANPTADQVEDETSLDIVCAQNDGLKVLYGPYLTEWDNLVTMALNISRANIDYANSSTAGWKHRKKGKLSFTLTAVEDEIKRTRFAKSDFVELQLFTSLTDFWQVRFGFVKSFTGIVANRDTGEIIKQTVNFEGSLRDYQGENPGCIILPEESEPWVGVAPD